MRPMIMVPGQAAAIRGSRRHMPCTGGAGALVTKDEILTEIRRMADNDGGVAPSPRHDQGEQGAPIARPVRTSSSASLDLS